MLHDDLLCNTLVCVMHLRAGLRVQRKRLAQATSFSPPTLPGWGCSWGEGFCNLLAPSSVIEIRQITNIQQMEMLRWCFLQTRKKTQISLYSPNFVWLSWHCISQLGQPTCCTLYLSRISAVMVGFQELFLTATAGEMIPQDIRHNICISANISPRRRKRQMPL